MRVSGMAMIGIQEGFSDRRPKASGQTTLFERHDPTDFLRQGQNEFRIEWLGETSINDSGLNAVFAEDFGNLHRRVDH